MYKIKSNIKGSENINELFSFIRNNGVKLILFAETHGYLKEIPIQEQIIKNVKPDFFLYEMLEESKISSTKEYERFLKSSDKKDFSFISTYQDLKPTIKLAKKYNLPIIGCDVKNMCANSKHWLSKGFSKKEENCIVKKRENKQAKIINKYSRQGIVFVSLGAYHLRRGSITLKNLTENKFVIVYPMINGEAAFINKSYSKNPKVHYEIKLIKRK